MKVTTRTSRVPGKRDRHAARRRGERGVALILVLWVLALLAVLAVSFAGGARTELKIARNQYEAARAEAIADAGVTFGILGALDPAPQTHWNPDGERHELAYGEGALGVSVEDEGGKVDLNAGAPELLAGLLRRLGVAEDAARQVLDGILQRRRDALAAGNGVLAFRDVAELRLVPGMARPLYQALVPLVTVYNRNDRIDPLSAPPEVLRSLPGVAAAQVEAYLAARASAGAQPTALPPLAGADRFVAHSALQVITIRSEGRTPGGGRFVREAVVELSGTPPYRFLAWRQGESAAP